MEGKHPQFFVEMTQESLQPSRYILLIASVLPQVWHEPQLLYYIIMYRQTGELKYGLNYPDAKGQFASGDEFANWLNQHRQEGIITLVLSVDRDEHIVQLRIRRSRCHRSSGASGADSVSSQMIWLTLVFASSLSVAGQLCQNRQPALWR